MLKRQALLIMMLWANPVAAEPLAQDEHVTQKLMAAQVGDILRTNCPKVSARMFVVLQEMIALQSHATSKGHDEATIRAFIDDPNEKARIRNLAQEYLAKAGVTPGDPDSYCAVARAEVAAGSMAGSLMRVDP